MSMLAVIATPTTNLRVILFLAPGFHVVRCDFDPFLDRERRDVTDPMPAPCISSCCNAPTAVLCLQRAGCLVRARGDGTGTVSI